MRVQENIWGRHPPEIVADNGFMTFQTVASVHGPVRRTPGETTNGSDNPTIFPRLRPLSEVYAEGLEPLEWVIEEMLPMKAITLVIGDPKVGKTTMFLSWLRAMYLTGTDWCGFTVQPSVCWLMTDEGARSLSRAIEKVGIPVDNEQHHHEVSIISDNELSWDELCEWISDRIVTMQSEIERAAEGGWEAPIPPRVVLIDNPSITTTVGVIR